MPSSLSSSPLAPWMIFILRLSGALNVIAGMSWAIAYRLLFKFFGLETPELTIFIQIAGLLMALLGIGLWIAARNPLENRGVVALALVAQSLLAGLVTYKIARGKLPS